mmetsp:Transcript_19548/g.50478  ORF Transcript_19548/g.50478 Transcript_19548/m.50478 type:complete len:519 (-) Transcript_19548:576-2132(-)
MSAWPLARHSRSWQPFSLSARNATQSCSHMPTAVASACVYDTSSVSSTGRVRASSTAPSELKASSLHAASSSEQSSSGCRSTAASVASSIERYDKLTARRLGKYLDKEAISALLTRTQRLTLSSWSALEASARSAASVMSAQNERSSSRRDAQRTRACASRRHPLMFSARHESDSSASRRSCRQVPRSSHLTAHTMAASSSAEQPSSTSEWSAAQRTSAEITALHPERLSTRSDADAIENATSDSHSSSCRVRSAGHVLARFVTDASLSAQQRPRSSACSAGHSSCSVCIVEKPWSESDVIASSCSSSCFRWPRQSASSSSRRGVRKTTASSASHPSSASVPSASHRALSLPSCRQPESTSSFRHGDETSSALSDSHERSSSECRWAEVTGRVARSASSGQRDMLSDSRRESVEAASRSASEVRHTQPDTLSVRSSRHRASRSRIAVSVTFLQSASVSRCRWCEPVTIGRSMASESCEPETSRASRAGHVSSVDAMRTPHSLSSRSRACASCSVRTPS